MLHRLLAISYVMIAVSASGALTQEDVSQRQPGKSINALTYAESFGITLAHLISDDPARQETGKRMSDGIVITGLLADGLQHATRSARPAPYQDDVHAFPSGHASLAFTVAASLSEREPSLKYIAYPLAAAAGWARHDLQRHTWAQVIGGAVLGTFVGIKTGRGEWRIFGHRDADLAQPLQPDDGGTRLSRSDRARLTVWSANF